VRPAARGASLLALATPRGGPGAATANVVPVDEGESEGGGSGAAGDRAVLNGGPSGGPEGDGNGGGDEDPRRDSEAPGPITIEPGLLSRLRAQAWLDAIDQTGAWTVVSAFLAFSLFLLETMNEERFGGWDVLFRDDLPWYYGLSMSTLSYVEGVTNTIFIAEFVVRAWIAGFSPAFFTNPYNLVDLASASPPLFALLGTDPRALRLLRVSRVLRLLRLLDRDPDSVLFGVFRTDDSGTQLLGVAAEFVCIFAIAAAVLGIPHTHRHRTAVRDCDPCREGGHSHCCLGRAHHHSRAACKTGHCVHVTEHEFARVHDRGGAGGVHRLWR
jgi:Ion transport protein